MYRSPNIVRVIKSRRLRWAGHVARMEEGRSAFKIFTGKPRGRKGPDAFFSCVIYNVGLKRDGNGEWRRLLHNEELHSLYRSPNTVKVIKSRRLIWVEHVARMEEGRSAFKILTGKINTFK